MTDEQLQTLWQDLNNAAMRKGGDRRPIHIQFAHALLAPAEQKPVAWFIADDNGEVYRATGYEHERDQWRAVGHEVYPLYASPHKPCLHVRLLNDTCEDCGATFLFI